LTIEERRKCGMVSLHVSPHFHKANDLLRNKPGIALLKSS
jgi:hypothetical protein